MAPRGLPPGSSWLPLARPGLSWLHLAPPGSSWLLLTPPGSQEDPAFPGPEAFPGPSRGLPEVFQGLILGTIEGTLEAGVGLGLPKSGNFDFFRKHLIDNLVYQMFEKRI